MKAFEELATSEVVLDELIRFREMLDRDDLVENTQFVDVWEYEDEYSHNEIDEFQRDFKKFAEQYVAEKAPGRYRIVVGGGSIVIIPQKSNR